MRNIALVSAVLAATAAVLAPTGEARARVVPLPWPPTVLPKEPPLAPATTGVLPLNVRFLGQLENRERVVVGLEDNGMPRSIRVLQTIVVKRLGDYVFSVPAPVRSVLPGPGTQSPPGQRVNQILWEGFSPGHRVLAAWADLRVPESAPSLPVRVALVTEIGGSPLAAGDKRSGDLRVRLTVSNVTGVTARSYTANPEPTSFGQVLTRIRSAIRRGVFAEGLNIGLLGPAPWVNTRVAAPLRVEGVLRFEPGTVDVRGSTGGVVRVAGKLDGLRRTQLRLVLHGRAKNASAPKLELRVRTEPVSDRVKPSQGLRTRLARTIDLELGYARKRQYDMFLASPDLTGRSSTTYVYRTVAAPRALPAAAGPKEDGSSVGWIVLALGLALGVPVAAVAWAHS
jgi:hypothetical protein